MIVAVTGHRPDKLSILGWSGFDEKNPLRRWVRTEIARHLLELDASAGITGMALGADQDFAEVCIELGIPFTAAVPFLGQQLQWPRPSRKRYDKLLAAAHKVVIINEGGYERWKMQARNEWSVDHAELLLAVFDGSFGGTANTVNYADRIGREKRRINPDDFRKGYEPPRHT